MFGKKKKEKTIKNNNQNDAELYVPKNKSKLAEKIDMYDMIIANLIAGNSIIDTEVPLDNSQLAVGFSSVSS